MRWFGRILSVACYFCPMCGIARRELTTSRRGARMGVHKNLGQLLPVPIASTLPLAFARRFNFAAQRPRFRATSMLVRPLDSKNINLQVSVPEDEEDERLDQWRRIMGLSKTQFQSFAENAPAEALRSLSVELPALEALRKRLKLNAKGLRSIVGLLPSQGLSSEFEVMPRLDWYQERLNFTDTEMGRMILKWPHILSLDIELDVIPKLDFLQKRLELTNADISKIMWRHSSILAYGIDDRLAPQLDWLEQRLHARTAQMRKIVVGAPEAMGLHLFLRLLPAIDQLQKKLLLSDAELRSFVVKYPRVLVLSTEENIFPSLAKLQDRLELSTAELKRLLMTLPSLLGCNVDTNILPKLEFLQSTLLLSVKELRQEVLRYPLVLGSSLKHCLRPNFQMLSGDLSAKQLQALVKKHGLRCVCCSHQRLSRRLEQAASMGVQAIVVVPKMRLTDPEFDEWLGRYQTRLAA